MAEEDNKSIAIEIAKNISTNLSATFKKSLSSLTKAHTKGTTGFLKSAEDLVDNNKAKQESFANSITSIKDSIHSAFPKIIQNIKTSLAPPPASEPTAGTKVTPVEIINEDLEVEVSVAELSGEKAAPGKDDPSGFFTDLGKKMDKSISGLFGDKKETKDSTPEVIKESNATIVDTLKERFSTLSSAVSTLAGVPAPTPEGTPRTEATIPPAPTPIADAPAAADDGAETTTTIESTSKTIVETLKERFNTLSSAISTLAGAPAPTPEGTPRTEATAPPIDVTVDAPAAVGDGAETTEAIEKSNSSLASMITTIKETSSGMIDSLQTGFYNASHWLEKVDSSSEKESEASSQTIVGRLQESATSTINSLGSVFTKQSDEVEDSIKEQTDVAQDMAAADEEGKATEEVMKVESDREKATADSEQMQILRDIRDSLKGSFGAVSKDKKKGGLLAGLLGGIGAGIGAIAKGIAKIGVGFGKGMIALGVGIAGFMLALGTASVILGLMGADGKALKTIIQTFFGAFDDRAAAMMGGLIAIAAIMAKLKISSTKFALSMGALGAGIGGFFLAIGAASWVAEAAGLNGVALANLIRTFFGAFDDKAAVMMGGIVAVAAICAKLEVNSVKLAAGMTAIGFGLAGFFGGIIAADFISSIAAADGIDGTKLKNLMGNFFGIFDSKEKMAVLAAVIGVGALAGFTGNSKGVFTGMTAIGMGLAGFFGGIILADAGASIAAGIGSGIDGTALKTLMNNFFGIFDSEEKVATLSAVLGVGALTGIVGGAKAALGIFAGMTAMGAGLAGFFGGILLADWLANVAAAEGINGKSLSVLISNFVDAFSSSGKTGVALLAAILGVGAIVGIVGAAAPGVGAAVIAGGIFAGMTAMGAGLVGFFGGIMLADKLTALFAVDGSGLATLIENFLGAFKSKKDIATLALLLGAAGAASFNPIGVAAGMTAIGAGLVGFFGAFMVGSFLTDIMGVDTEKVKTFMGDIGEGIGRFVGGLAGGVIKQLKDIDGQKLKDLGDGIAGIGVGIAAFGLGKAVGLIGGVMGALGSFFGMDSPIDQIIAISANKNIDAGRLKELGEGIGPLGEGLKAFSGFEMSGSWIGDSDLEKFIKLVASLGDSKININTDQIRKIGQGVGPLGEGMKGFSGIDFEHIDDIDDFFAALNSRKVAQMASPEELIAVSKGIAPLGLAMKGFAGIDMDAITGGVGEDNLGKFAEGMGQMVKNIEDPGKLKEVASGIEVLGEAMSTFKGIDSDKLDFSRFFASLEAGDPERMKKNLEMLKWIKGKDAGGAGAGGVGTQAIASVTPSIDVAQTSEALGSDTGKSRKGKRTKSAREYFTTTKPESLVSDESYQKGEYKGVKGAWTNTGDGWFFQSDEKVKYHTGGIVPVDGPIVAQGGEFILDQQAAQVFMKAATLLTGSQVLEQSRAGDGGPPVVINQVDNSQANPVISNQATQIKASESPHARESTKAMLDQAYAMG